MFKNELDYKLCSCRILKLKTLKLLSDIRWLFINYWDNVN